MVRGARTGGTFDRARFLTATTRHDTATFAALLSAAVTADGFFWDIRRRRLEVFVEKVLRCVGWAIRGDIPGQIVLLVRGSIAVGDIALYDLPVRLRARPLATPIEADAPLSALRVIDTRRALLDTGKGSRKNHQRQHQRWHLAIGSLIDTVPWM